MKLGHLQGKHIIWIDSEILYPELNHINLFAGLGKEGAVRRRKKTSSSSRSRHSSKNSSSCDDLLNKCFEIKSDADDLSSSTDVHQLENETVDVGQEESGSFSIEFASNSNCGGTLANGDIDRDISVSQSVVFADSSGTSEFVVRSFHYSVLEKWFS